MLVAIAVSSITTSPMSLGMHMLSGRRAVIADAKTNVPTIPHQRQSSTGQLVSSTAEMLLLFLVRLLLLLMTMMIVMMMATMLQ